MAVAQKEVRDVCDILETSTWDPSWWHYAHSTRVGRLATAAWRGRGWSFQLFPGIPGGPRPLSHWKSIHHILSFLCVSIDMRISCFSNTFISGFVLLSRHLESRGISHSYESYFMEIHRFLTKLCGFEVNS